MLLDEIATATDLAAQVVKLRQSQLHAQSLDERRSLLDALTSRAARASRCRVEMADRLGEPLGSIELHAQVRLEVNAWQSHLQDDVAAALEGDEFQKIRDLATRAVAASENIAADQWRRYSSEQVPLVPSDVLEALKHDARARRTVSVILRISAEIDRLRSLTIPGPDEIEAFDGAAQELRDAWASLDVANIDAEVLAFLRATNDRGAPLGLLTEAVLSWLSARDAIDSYVIRPVQS